MGERTDREYFRCYDKGIESGTAPRGMKWRVELEAKKDLAPRLTREACESQDLTQWCVQRLVSSWKQAGYSWPLPASDAKLPPIRAEPKQQSSALEWALWVQTSIAPTMPRGLAAFTVNDVLELLGLDGLATAKVPNDGN